MMLIGLDGRPVKSRQQQREEARIEAKKRHSVATPSNQDMEKMREFLGIALRRTDIIIESLKMLGVTDEQFDQIETRLKAEADEMRARMGAQQDGGQQ
jgi:hypothetical protein